jgi:hypothetical protein
MQNELFVSMLRWSAVFSILRATVMAASSALLTVSHSDCYLIPMWVVVLVRGFTTPAPSIGLPLICEPYVYTKSRGFHFRLWAFVWSMYGIACAGFPRMIFLYMASCCQWCVRPFVLCRLMRFKLCVRIRGCRLCLGCLVYWWRLAGLVLWSLQRETYLNYISFACCLAL